MKWVVWYGRVVYGAWIDIFMDGSNENYIIKSLYSNVLLYKTPILQIFFLIKNKTDIPTFHIDAR